MEKIIFLQKRLPAHFVPLQGHIHQHQMICFSTLLHLSTAKHRHSLHRNYAKTALLLHVWSVNSPGWRGAWDFSLAQTHARTCVHSYSILHRAVVKKLTSASQKARARLSNGSSEMLMSSGLYDVHYKQQFLLLQKILPPAEDKCTVLLFSVT